MKYSPLYLLFLLPSLSFSDLEPGALLHVEVNMSGGGRLMLNDGSLWEVDPNDRPISSLWLSPAPLEVISNESSTYPYFLVDTRTQMKVKARPILP
jgi:hypothetical protein